MKNKVIFSFIVFILLLLIIVFANSYVLALSKQEKLGIHKELMEQQIENNKENFAQIYKNVENKIANCNTCQQNENCLMYEQNYPCEQSQNCQMYGQNYSCGQSQNQQHYNCITNSNSYSQKNYAYKKNCNTKMRNR